MNNKHWLPWLVAIGFLLLYLYTAAPSLVTFFDDTLEFQFVGPTFGIAHPTGYPLYLILSGLWSRLLFPFGNWAWRMNLFSALAGAVALGLLTACAQRLTRGAMPRLHWAPALAAALVYGLAPLWWQQTTVAEVYALHGCFVAALLAVAVRLLDDEPPAPVGLWSTQGLTIILCLLFGLGLAHHRTTLLLAPVIGLTLIWSVPAWWRPAPIWGQWALALLAPLLLYLWLPLRATMGVHDLHGSYVNSWVGFWDHVLARQYTLFLGENPLAVVRSAQDWWQLWLAQTSALGMALGLAGLAQLVIPRQRLRKGWRPGPPGRRADRCSAAQSLAAVAADGDCLCTPLSCLAGPGGERSW
ncbi:MAG TPA: DUF2723 domain-containing protein [Caldilineaceae bacterium]|nr:DUF2723 domain-containing protein [Caldilineaceae bacterium]